MLRHATFHAGQSTWTLVSKLRKINKKGSCDRTQIRFKKRYLMITCLKWQQAIEWRRNYPHFMGPNNSLATSQQSSTDLYRAPDESRSLTPNRFL
jgi:hypothetical protein